MCHSNFKKVLCFFFFLNCTGAVLAQEELNTEAWKRRTTNEAKITSESYALSAYNNLVDWRFLPPEIKEYTLSFLPPSDLVRFTRVNKEAHKKLIPATLNKASLEGRPLLVTVDVNWVLSNLDTKKDLPTAQKSPFNQAPIRLVFNGIPEKYKDEANQDSWQGIKEPAVGSSPEKDYEKFIHYITQKLIPGLGLKDLRELVFENIYINHKLIWAMDNIYKDITTHHISYKPLPGFLHNVTHFHMNSGGFSKDGFNIFALMCLRNLQEITLPNLRTQSNNLCWASHQNYLFSLHLLARPSLRKIKIKDKIDIGAGPYINRFFREGFKMGRLKRPIAIELEAYNLVLTDEYPSFKTEDEMLDFVRKWMSNKSGNNAPIIFQPPLNKPLIGDKALELIQGTR